MTAPTPARLPPLDGFRGVAVLLVMFTHLITAGRLVTPHTPLGRLLLSGFVGVDMFFVLSGFLITGVLLDAPREGFFRRFYARRALRIFPVYYGVLLASLALFRARGGDSPWWYLLFASNLGITLHGRALHVVDTVNLAHFWSLAVEEQFYVVWPVVVYALLRRRVAVICLWLMALAPLCAWAMALRGSSLGAYLFTLTRCNGLAAGALLAMAFRDPDQWARWMRHAPRVARIAGVVTLVGLCAPLRFVINPMAPLLWGAVLMLSLRPTGLVQRLFRVRALGAVGRISYGLYVYHALIDPWLKSRLHDRYLVALTGGNNVAALFLFVLTAGALSLALAWVSWNFLERPLLSLNKN